MRSATGPGRFAERSRGDFRHPCGMGVFVVCLPAAGSGGYFRTPLGGGSFFGVGPANERTGCSADSRLPCRTPLLLARFFLGQLHFGGVEFLLDFGEGFAVLLGRDGSVLLLDGALPVGQI